MRSRTPIARIVNYDGNQAAQKLLSEVFEVTDRAWRGIGVIPRSGWRLSEKYREFDAEERFKISGIHTEESKLCRAGDVLRGSNQARGVSGVREGVHAAASAWGHDGLERRRLCSLL